MRPKYVNNRTYSHVYASKLKKKNDLNTGICLTTIGHRCRFWYRNSEQYLQQPIFFLEILKFIFTFSDLQWHVSATSFAREILLNLRLDQSDNRTADTPYLT